MDNQSLLTARYECKFNTGENCWAIRLNYWASKLPGNEKIFCAAGPIQRQDAKKQR